MIRNRSLLLILYIIADMILITGCKKDNIEYSTVTDITGNIYRTVKIGNHWWIAENLKTEKYNDNREIPMVTSNAVWKGLTTGAFCYYDNNEQYIEDYGVLYNWYAINTGDLCPTGWHVPSFEEWNSLINSLGNIDEVSGKLRETGTLHWKYPNKGASNASGFSALPGGYRHPLGDFLEIGTMGYWWLATESYPGTAWCITLIYNGSLYMDPSYEKIWGFSVRCTKD